MLPEALPIIKGRRSDRTVIHDPPVMRQWVGSGNVLAVQLVCGLEAVQRRLDANPQAMRVRIETVEHPFGTLKMRMGATHFLMKRLPKVAIEMALQVLAYNLTRVMNIVGVKQLLAAIRA
jgi:Transposase DDE domain